MANMKSSDELKSLLAATDSVAGLESIGKNISVEHVHALSDLLEGSDLHKLSVIFVGLAPEVFLALLKSSTELQLQNLKNLAPTESVQHHLTLLSHDLLKRTSEGEEKIAKQAAEIMSMDTQDMGKQDVYLVENQLDLLAESFYEIKAIVNKALAIVWSTSRVDLIETFSRIKEHAENLLSQGIGRRENIKQYPRSLHAKLNEKLFAIYEHEKDIQKLEDEEPVIEALAKLSIWHLKDFIELGLIHEGFSKIQPITTSSEAKLKADIEYLKLAEERLRLIGLEKIRDLKKARIFSKRSLQEYIFDHREILADSTA